jgi:ABC-type transport system involved in multi-copper enzyme maturation permease subunit
MQTWAIFYDAYRDLSARRLFWITMLLSAIAIVAFGMLGVSNGKLNLLTIHLDAGFDPAGIYLYIFSYVVIGFWLTWIAVALALVSTAGIFPDLLASGTIDLYLARPIGRFRFFITKYVAGLLFVALQVTVFTVGSFIVMGVRGGMWKPSLFLAIPLVVCVFSYLFAVCVLFGVWMRSTIGALLLTLLVWGLCSGVFWADQKLFEASVEMKWMSRGDPSSQSGDQLRKIDNYARMILVPLPKIVPTSRLLDRWLLKKSDLMGISNSADESVDEMRLRMGMSDSELAELHSRETGGDPAYTIGSSLAFEAVCFGLAAWIFCRRDY